MDREAQLQESRRERAQRYDFRKARKIGAIVGGVSALLTFPIFLGLSRDGHMVAAMLGAVLSLVSCTGLGAFVGHQLATRHLGLFALLGPLTGFLVVNIGFSPMTVRHWMLESRHEDTVLIMLGVSVAGAVIGFIVDGFLALMLRCYARNS